MRCIHYDRYPTCMHLPWLRRKLAEKQERLEQLSDIVEQSLVYIQVATLCAAAVNDS